jgi:outer membrane protein assembly factor BamB
MKRRDFVALLLASGATGCGIFGGDKKTPLPGERIPVLGMGGVLAADPKLADVAVNLPPAEVNPEWPEAGGNPTHSMGHLALPPKLGQAWQAGIGAGSARYTRVLSQPVIAGGRVFTMDGAVQASALDAATGKSIWQVDLKPDKQLGSAFGGGPVFWKDRLYVSTGFAQVLALDPGNGKVIWRRDVSAPVHAQPTVSDGRVFAVTVENTLDVLSTDDGHRLWTHNGIPETAGLLGGASPAVDSEVAVVAYTSGELFALRVENGRAVWSTSLAAGHAVNAVAGLADIRGRPVIDRGKVFAISHSGRMAAINLRTGDRVWEQEIASSHSPWAVGDFVFALANDNELVCLTHDEGKVRWAHPLPRFEDETKHSDPIYWAGPVVGGSRIIVVSSNGEARSLAPATGQLLGQQQIAANAYIEPAIANNVLYVLTDDATLTAYR